MKTRASVILILSVAASNFAGSAQTKSTSAPAQHKTSNITPAPRSQDIAEWLKGHIYDLSYLRQECQGGQCISGISLEWDAEEKGCVMDISNVVSSVRTVQSEAQKSEAQQASNGFKAHVKFAQITSIETGDNSEAGGGYCAVTAGHPSLTLRAPTSDGAIHVESIYKVSDSDGFDFVGKPDPHDSASLTLVFKDSESRDRVLHAMTDLVHQCGGKVEKSLY